MKFTGFLREFLFLIFALYLSQGLIYPSGSFFSQICLALILLISGVYFVKSLLLPGKTSMFFIAWTIFLLVNILGFLITADFSLDNHNQMFKAILGCMLPFYPFYYFANKDELKAPQLVRFFLVMLLIIIFQFFRLRNMILLDRYSDNLDVVNNESYDFVNLIPFVFLIKKKKIISGVLMGLLLFFIIQGSKRGAIIAGVLGLLGYFYYLLKTIEKKNRIRGYIVAIIVLFGISAFGLKIYLSNEFLIDRMTSLSEGNTSGRNFIYETIFNAWYNSESVWNYLTGFGFASSLKITGDSYAHSDWLELLSNFGLIGIGAYMLLFYSATKQCLNKYWMEDKRTLMLTITMIWFSTSLISMWYMSIANFTQAILLGYLAGNKEKSLT